MAINIRAKEATKTIMPLLLMTKYLVINLIKGLLETSVNTEYRPKLHSCTGTLPVDWGFFRIP